MRVFICTAGNAHRYDGRSDGGTEAAAAPASDFTFLAILWTGDYGHVALARHEPTGSTKTVMVMEAARRTNQTRMDRNVMAAVSAFPFVARLEWLALDGVGRTYVVMPLVAACNLFELMAERGSFDEPTARFYTTQVRFYSAATAATVFTKCPWPSVSTGNATERKPFNRIHCPTIAPPRKPTF